MVESVFFTAANLETFHLLLTTTIVFTAYLYM